MGSPSSHKTRDTLIHLKDSSIRRIVAGEKAVERSFNEARLLTTLAVGLMLVGFLLVAQWRGNATLENTLERQSDQNLAIIIQELTTENATIRNEIMSLRSRLLSAEKETEDQSEVLNQAARELNSFRVLAGIDAAVGSGIVVHLSDSERVLLPQDFVAMVNELRAGGAEAISVNGIRVGAQSGFSAEGTRIILDGTVLARDFEVEAIGDPGYLEQALILPGGLRTTLSTFPGVSMEIEQVDGLWLAAAEIEQLEYGEPFEEQ